MSTIRVLIVEDDPIIGEDIRDILTNVDYTAIGVAYSKAEAIDYINNENPDLVLLDINLDGNYEGFDIAEHINQTRRIPFLYLTSYSGKEIIERAKPTMPMGYIVKPFNEKELYSNIEVALYNFSKFVLPATFNIQLINSKINSSLTQREFDILEGLFEGKTNRQLAESNFISVNTVKTHIKNIYEKMNTNTRSETITLVHSLLL
ncbi:response regulator transcription factor [Winogradskyella sp.]|jgi:DNA-binding NarL/FixJ family response regulator|uniref:response regulator transcription factor n=1 Tax=Winogradskyella sp. TaxID=1883156 RepID=UPI0025DF7391|nr:response regulator transcription factor [Winogradskyella sp.]MCT4628973.1 response regulator transcription factor [Winogradskyella sp.]